MPNATPTIQEIAEKLAETVIDDVGNWTDPGGMVEDEGYKRAAFLIAQALTQHGAEELREALKTIRIACEHGLSPAMGKSWLGPYGTLESIQRICDDALGVEE